MSSALATPSSTMRIASAGTVEERGTVRITASETIGVEVLPPLLAGLRRAYPSIAIELALSNRNEDLVHGAADIAVRMVRPQQQTLVAKRVGIVRLGIYAHKTYVKEFGVPRSIGDLAHHVLIGFDRNSDLLQLVRSWGMQVTREDFSFRSDSDHAQLAALRAGFGIGICQSGIAQREPDLRPVLEGEFDLSMEMWLAMHRDMRANRRTRIVFDYLARELAGYTKE